MVHHDVVQTEHWNTSPDISHGADSSHNAEFPWPPYSPDFNPPDFFLWGCLTERIDAKNPQVLDGLKINIQREVRNIPEDMIARVIASFNV